MAIKYTDNCKTTLAAPILAGDTTLTVNAGDGVLFPNPGVGDFFFFTIIESLNPDNLEICQCTSRAGDVLSSITRGLGGTNQGWAAGSRIELRVCKLLLDSISVVPSGLLNPTPTISVAGYTASSGDLIYADTSGGSFAITMPLAPVKGDRIGVIDITLGGSFQSNPLDLTPNGDLIDGVNDTFRLDVNKLYVELVYDDTNSNWVVGENPLGGSASSTGGGGGVIGVPTRLGARDIAVIDTDTNLYTVGAEYPSEIVIKICNRNNAVVAVRLAHIDGALGAVSLEDYILYDVLLQPYETKFIEVDGAVQNDTFLIRSDTTNVSFMATAKLPLLDANLSRIAATTVVADTDTALLVTAGAEYEDCSIFVCNRDGISSGNIRIALIDGAIGVISPEDYIVYDDVILPSETKLFQDSLHIPDNSTLMVRSSNANINFVLYGRLYVAP